MMKTVQHIDHTYNKKEMAFITIQSSFPQGLWYEIELSSFPTLD